MWSWLTVIVVDGDSAGGVEEVVPFPVGGGVLVAGQFAGEEVVAVAGEHGEGGVGVDVEGLIRPSVRPSAGSAPAGRRWRPGPAGWP